MIRMAFLLSLVCILLLDERNIAHLLNYKVQTAAVAAYELDQYRDRQLFPVVLPILSLLVNYGKDHFLVTLLERLASSSCF